MFIGRQICSLDNKKRVAIPSKFRNSLGKKAIVTRGFEKSLAVYSLPVWKTEMERIEKLSIYKADKRAVSRAMLTGAEEVNLDKLGRILIPDHLKDYAVLKRNVFIVGVYNRIEIWDKDKWEKYDQEAKKEFDNNAERLEEK